MTRSPSKSPNFDLIARPYQWLEYMSLGPMLERCRNFRLPVMVNARRAIVFGDGDGRFLARLLYQNSSVTVEVVDSSVAMLRLLEERVKRMGAESRVALHHADALQFNLPGEDYDLVASHFFLDCFAEPEIKVLIDRVRPCLAVGAQWLTSEFARPTGRAAAWLGELAIAGLYRGFGAVTGLRVRRLPLYAPLFESQGFLLKDRHVWLGGLLASELWELSECRPDPARTGNCAVDASLPQERLSMQTFPRVAVPLMFGSVPGIDPGALPNPLPGFPGPAPDPDPSTDPSPTPVPDPDPGLPPGPTPEPVF